MLGAKLFGFRLTALGGFIVLLANTAITQSVDAHVGTWKLNVAKSTWVPGGASPPPGQVAVTTIESVGAGLKVQVSRELPNGTVTRFVFTADFNGKDAPIVGDPNTDTVALTRIHERMIKMVNKKNGKVTATQVSSVSADGQLRILTTTTMSATGQPVEGPVRVWDRQSN
jgi:hypothetical protein